jgi:polyphosphate kinase
MTRNLSRRVEAISPIESPQAFLELQEILGILLADNRHAWELQSDGKYIQRQSPAEQIQSAQAVFMKMALKTSADDYGSA